MCLYDILLSSDVVEAIHKNIDYLLKIIPEIKYMIGFSHKHPHHHLDVWEHTILAISLSKMDYDIRLALLLHDIGKPFSYQEGEIRHFKNHPKVSSDMAKVILKRLNYEDSYIDKICYLIKYHDSPITDLQIYENYHLVLKLFEIQKSDALAHNPLKLEKREKYLKEIKEKLLSKRM